MKPFMVQALRRYWQYNPMNAKTSNQKSLKANVALCSTLQLTADGGAPDWVELIPAGYDVAGRDGRAWVNPNPAQVIARTLNFNSGRDPVIDYEHATDRKAPKGEPAPASGWFKEFELREGAIWGRAEWTSRAAQMVAAKEYRYLSPVFAFNPQTREILYLERAGLTNDPNLVLTALNSTQNTESENMDKVKLRAALGLPDDADDAAIDVAIAKGRTALNAANSSNQQVDLERYVPRAQHEAVVSELNSVKATTAAAEKTAFETKVEAALSAAIVAGKLVPSAKDDYKAMCSTEAGLASFESAMAKAPKVVNTETGDATKGETAQNSTLSAEDKQVARMLGHDDAAFSKIKNEGNA